ncbi:RagB/SusD family nutrient uptake outer membrane protein [Zunongwangia sp. F363]|uniref:RagB/SusD family nutrient uptake outer membrane protein n=1 Tax=Autumnicola tepida TaxID=3075595 RepID=A0ABU3C7C6_9FLAO|nr:RagB/SusD family nutrient uptake outer membrane protein [Zunongwangia sp. F363]MDT0642243.1 RagB/SusD family nutrient uptake outer membrane protein [Zunongwangia sp. F363]
MKKIFGLLMCTVLIWSCNDELDVPIQSVISGSDVPLNSRFINTQVIAAYAMLDGNQANDNVWRAAASNWVYGEVAADNAYKGSDAGDQSEITAFETYAAAARNSYVDYKWVSIFEGVSRTNIAINAIQGGLEAGTLTEEQANEFLGEMRFLRGHYHFEAKKMFGNVPYIDETTTESTTNMGVDVWARIEEDFQFAVDNLEPLSTRVGGANSWNAKAYLAKAHMYQLDYDAAKPLLEDIINNGPYALNTYFHDNFNAETNNSVESVFAVQNAVNDGSNNSSNAAWGEVLNFPNGSPIGGGCCGFMQPSHNLVNAYKTDASGLPLLDTFNESNINNVDPQDDSPSGFADDETFVEEPGNLDPRLDWTVGRKGIPFLGWGDFPGLAWIRDPANGGPYVSKKIVYSADQAGSVNSLTGWNTAINSINTNIIRYAEILLWRAEIAAAEGDLTMAANLVDQVRARAANPDTWVMDDDGTPAANYEISLYSENGGFPDQEFAEKAVMFEYRLETALEGHRFFDLVRRGKAEEVLNEYLDENDTRSYLQGASYSPTAAVFPIPQPAIDLSGGVLEQNPGY